MLVGSARSREFRGGLAVEVQTTASSACYRPLALAKVTVPSTIQPPENHNVAMQSS
jgi:hypothetical protein